MTEKQPADWQDRMMLYYDSEIAQMYRRKIERLESQYNELLFAVSNKYAGESRHETALRYIRNAETLSGEARSIRTPIATAAQLGHHTGDTGE